MCSKTCTTEKNNDWYQKTCANLLRLSLKSFWSCGKGIVRELEPQGAVSVSLLKPEPHQNVWIFTVKSYRKGSELEPHHLPFPELEPHQYDATPAKLIETMVCFWRIAPHTFKCRGDTWCCGSTAQLCTVWREFLLEPTIAPISIDVAPALGRKNDAALYLAVTFLSAYTTYTTGLRIRIDSIRIRTQIWIRIQQFRSIRIRIRIRKVSESGSTKSLNTDPIQIRIHNPGVQCTVYSKLWNLYLWMRLCCGCGSNSENDTAHA
jgi:hypothetical protein